MYDTRIGLRMLELPVRIFATVRLFGHILFELPAAVFAESHLRFQLVPVHASGSDSISRLNIAPHTGQAPVSTRSPLRSQGIGRRMRPLGPEKTGVRPGRSVWHREVRTRQAPNWLFPDQAHGSHAEPDYRNSSSIRCTQSASSGMCLAQTS